MINIITGFYSSSRELLDKRSGPYDSVSAALTTLGTNDRSVGLSVIIVENSIKDSAGNYIGGTPLKYIFSNGIEDSDLIPDNSLDGTYVKRAGDSMTGYLTLNDDPTNPLHAASKRYVDELVNTVIKSPDGFATNTSGDYPTDYKSSGVVLNGDSFYVTDVSNGTTVGTKTVNVGDYLIAIIDNPGNTDSNWIIMESNRDQATETVLGMAKIAEQSDVDAGTNDTKFITPLKLSTTSLLTDKYVPFINSPYDVNLGTHALVAGAMNPTNLETDRFVHYDGSKLVSGNIYQHTNGHIGMFDVPSDDYELYVDGTAGFANNVTVNLNATVKGNIFTNTYGKASDWYDAYKMRYMQGFDLQNPVQNGTLSWDDSTRVFTIAPATNQSSYTFWSNNIKIIHTAAHTVLIPDITGIYYIYFDEDGNLKYFLPDGITDAAFYKYALVAMVSWNKTVQKAIIVGNEQHGINMSATTHQYNHDTYGTRYEDGIDIEGLTNGGTTYTQTTGGHIWDEDIRHTLIAETTHPFLYRLGTDGEWTITAVDNKVVYMNGGTVGVWNEYNGTEWILSEGTSSTDFYIYFYVAIPNLIGNQVFKLIGQNAYSTRAKARNAIETEVRKLELEGLPSKEYIFLYATIVKRDGTLKTLADGSVIYDLRYLRGGHGSASASSNYAVDIITDTTNFNTILSDTDTNVQLALDTIDDKVVPYTGALYDVNIGEHTFTSNSFISELNGVTTSFQAAVTQTALDVRASMKIGNTSGDNITTARLFIVPDISSAVQRETAIEVRTNPVNSAAEKRFRMWQGPSLAGIVSSSNDGGSSDPGTPWELDVLPHLHQLYLDTSGNVGIGKIPDADTKFDVDGNIKADKIIKKDGLSTQFLKADGSIDDTVYATTGTIYDSWKLYIDGTLKGTIETDKIVNFVGGDNTTLAYSTTNDNTVTINSTDTQLTNLEVLSQDLTGFSAATSLINLSATNTILNAFEALEYRVHLNDEKYTDVNHFPGYSTSTPLMDGAASVGTLDSVARADHRHPTDTSRYAANNPDGFISANQSITLSGDISGTGTTSISTTLSTVNSNIGTFNNLTVNAKGLVTSASNVAYLTSFTETDPIFTASPAYGIGSGDITNWNTAYTNRITSLTTVGTQGVATLENHIINIPDYSSQKTIGFNAIDPVEDLADTVYNNGGDIENIGLYSDLYIPEDHFGLSTFNKKYFNVINGVVRLKEFPGYSITNTEITNWNIAYNFGLGLNTGFLPYYDGTKLQNSWIQQDASSVTIAKSLTITALVGSGNRCLYVTDAGVISAKTDDCGTSSGTGDNLGNHIATQNIQLGSYYLAHDSANKGITVNSNYEIGINSELASGDITKINIGSNGFFIKTAFDTSELLIGNGTSNWFELDDDGLTYFYGSEFNVYGDANFSKTLTATDYIKSNTYLQAPTARLTNLSDNTVPYHVSDTAGLANSPITVSGTNVGINCTTHTKLGIQGDISIYANNGLFGNLYYDNGWKHIISGYGGYVKFRQDGGIDISVATSQGGVDAAATTTNAIGINSIGNVTMPHTAEANIVKAETHDSPSSPSMSPTIYGTDATPTVDAANVPEGTIYIQYTA